MYSMVPREHITSSHAQIYQVTGSSREVFFEPSTVLIQKLQQCFPQISPKYWPERRISVHVLPFGSSKVGKIKRLFLLLLPCLLRGKGNGQEECGVGLLGIFFSSILLAEEGRLKFPNPQALLSSKVHTWYQSGQTMSSFNN